MSMVDGKIKLRRLLFFCSIFILTRQVPFNDFSIIMNICISVLLMIDITSHIKYNGSNKDDIFLLSIIAVLFFYLFYSIFLNNEIDLALRFFTINIFLIFAYYIYPDKLYFNYFIIFMTLQVLIVILLEFIMLVFFNPFDYAKLRYIIWQNKWGDIYTINNKIYRIQIVGNALIPFFIMIIHSFYYSRCRYILLSIGLVSVLFAGNFAFTLGIILYALLYAFNIKLPKNKLLAILSVFFVVLFILMPFLYNAFLAIILQKSINSNPLRIDQLNVLTNNLLENYRSLIFGQGFGNTVDVITNLRDYTGRTYYELQSIYFINQNGLLLTILLILFHVLISVKIFSKEKLVIYLSYIFYSLFNPYFLDTSHIVVIIVLKSINEVERFKKKGENSTHHCCL